jgi:hypothetical protein
MRDAKEKLSNLTIFLHWVVGLTIIAYNSSFFADWAWCGFIYYDAQLKVF